MGIWKLNHEIRDCSLPAAHKAIMWVLESYITKPKESAYPSIATLVRQTGHSRSSVKRALRELNDGDIVRWTHRLIGSQIVNHYRFNPAIQSLGGRSSVDLLWGQREPTVGPECAEGGSTVDHNSIKTAL